MNKKNLVLLLSLFTGALTVSAQNDSNKYPLTIYVRDAETIERIDDARVYIDGKEPKPSKIPDPGTAHFYEVPEGRIHIRVEHDIYLPVERTDFNVSRNPADNNLVILLKKRFRDIKGSGMILDEDNRPLQEVPVRIRIGDLSTSVQTDQVGIYEFEINNVNSQAKDQQVEYYINRDGYDMQEFKEPIRDRDFIKFNIVLPKIPPETFDVRYELRPKPVPEKMNIFTSSDTEIIGDPSVQIDGRAILKLTIPQDKKNIPITFDRPGYYSRTFNIDVEQYLRYPYKLIVNQKKECNNGLACWIGKRSYLIPGIHSYVHEEKLINKLIKGTLQVGSFSFFTYRFCQEQSYINETENAISQARSTNEIRDLTEQLSNHRRNATIWGTLASAMIVLDFAEIPSIFRPDYGDNRRVGGPIVMIDPASIGAGYYVKF